MKRQQKLIKISGITSVIISLAFSMMAFPVSAQDNSDHEFRVSLGYGRFFADELVYSPISGARISMLEWEAKAPVVTIGTRHQLGNNWILSGNLALNINGDGHLSNYDWIDYDGAGPFTPGTGRDDWTGLSQHPDTELENYLDLELALGRNVTLDDNTAINLHAGLKYTSIEFDAYGGNLTQSLNAFRDVQGSIPDGRRVISYKQWHRTAFGGAEITHSRGDWQLTGLFRAGISFEPRDTDNHWRRNLRYDQEFESAPFAQIGLGATRQLENGILIHAKLNYQKYFDKRGDTRITNYTDGSVIEYENAVGADLSATVVEFGISRSF